MGWWLSRFYQPILECGSGPSWSQPRNWHRRLWIYLSSTICRFGWNPFHREIPISGHNWQLTQLVRKPRLDCSQWHIWFCINPSTARLFEHTTSMFCFPSFRFLSLLTLSKGHAIPTVEYKSVAVEVSSGSSALNIHPNGDNTKCVGILGGAFADGTPVDMYVTRLMYSNFELTICLALIATGLTPRNGSGTVIHWLQSTLLIILNGVLMPVSILNVSKSLGGFMFHSCFTPFWKGANGVRMKIWQCFSGLPQQTWTPVTTSGTIKLTTASFCLDLTNGVKTNQNILQIWTCGSGNPNQFWTVTSAWLRMPVVFYYPTLSILYILGTDLYELLIHGLSLHSHFLVPNELFI